MAIADRVRADARSEQQAPRRARPRWRTSRLPWIVTGAVGLALVVGGLVVYSIRSTDNTIDRSRTNVVQSCIDSGGAAAECTAVFGTAQGTTGADSSADNSALDSISS